MIYAIIIFTLYYAQDINNNPLTRLKYAKTDTYFAVIWLVNHCLYRYRGSGSDIKANSVGRRIAGMRSYRAGCRAATDRFVGFLRLGRSSAARHSWRGFTLVEALVALLLGLLVLYGIHKIIVSGVKTQTTTSVQTVTSEVT